MEKSKHYNAVLCFAVLLFANTAYAQWPVFDFQEIIPIGKDVKTGVDTLKDLKTQLTEINNTLNAIGKEVGTIAGFAESISAIGIGDTQSATDNAKDTSTNNSNTIGQVTDNVSDTTENTLNTQKDMVDDYVNQTQQVVGIQNSKQNTQQINKNLISRDVLQFEEEEEEEEISVNDTEELEMLQQETLAEQKQLSIELNDVLETQLTILNRSIATNVTAFEELDKTLQSLPQLNETDKDKLHNRILQILQKQRDVSDWAIRIVESAKENYNREYNNVIKDGINNYGKVVVAYMKGDASRENVINSGNRLKQAVSAINVKPDSMVLTELKRAAADINKDVESLTVEINNILKEQD